MQMAVCVLPSAVGTVRQTPSNGQSASLVHSDSVQYPARSKLSNSAPSSSEHVRVSEQSALVVQDAPKRERHSPFPPLSINSQRASSGQTFGSSSWQASRQ